MVKCKKCSKNNPDIAEYCQECGTPLKKPEDKKDKKFGEFTGNTIIDTIIWILIVLIVGGLFVNYVLGPIFSLI
jgi:predicted amidophosphoribosyltransferase